MPRTWQTGHKCFAIPKLQRAHCRWIGLFAPSSVTWQSLMSKPKRFLDISTAGYPTNEVRRLLMQNGTLLVSAAVNKPDQHRRALTRGTCWKASSNPYFFQCLLGSQGRITRTFVPFDLSAVRHQAGQIQPLDEQIHWRHQSTRLSHDKTARHTALTDSPVSLSKPEKTVAV